MERAPEAVTADRSHDEGHVLATDEPAPAARGSASLTAGAGLRAGAEGAPTDARPETRTDAQAGAGGARAGATAPGGAPGRVASPGGAHEPAGARSPDARAPAAPSPPVETAASAAAGGPSSTLTPVRLAFDRGSILVRAGAPAEDHDGARAPAGARTSGAEHDPEVGPERGPDAAAEHATGLAWLAGAVPDLRHDGRVGALRAPAYRYHAVVRALVARGAGLEDGARVYGTLDAPQVPPAEPRDYQREAVVAWRRAGRRGQVVLPTGAGKTLVAIHAIADARRHALVVVPTLDLLHQWYGLLATHWGDARVGVIGGGEHRPLDVTVTTYDSAYLHMDRLGARFGLVVWDEAHHLAGPSLAQAARMALAPFALALTATPLEDERAGLVADLVGATVYRREIGDLAGDWLSPYETVRLPVSLSAPERAAHDEARAVYRAFVERNGLRLGGPHGWGRFLEATSRSAEGRAALRAWREQRRIALATPAKLDVLETLLARHPGERVIVFTSTNEAAYAVSRRFLVPAITHQTRPSERRQVLLDLAAGEVPVVATSRVLNEGVDVPSVSVGVVLSGTATVREHVQRLGRLLRKAEGKRAVLYEVVTEGTSEEGASARRREHGAYR